MPCVISLTAPNKDYTELPVFLSFTSLSLSLHRSPDISNHLICHKLAQVYKWLSRWFVWVCHKSQIKGVPVQNTAAELDQTVESYFFFSVVSFTRDMYTKWTDKSHSLKISVMSLNIAHCVLFCQFSHSVLASGWRLLNDHLLKCNASYDLP